MKSNSGNYVANQFIIRTANGLYFQSYNSPIVLIDNNYQTWLSKDWEYSPTTGKYRNLFLREDKKTTLLKLQQGIYKIIDLEIID